MSDTTSPFQHETPELRRALDEGEVGHLSDNTAPGILGEGTIDIHKTDSYAYADRAGLSQEETAPVRWLIILILYLLVLTGPLAIWMLWRDGAWKTWQKAVITAFMLAGYAALAWKVLG
jgi:hypothetical protein